MDQQLLVNYKDVSLNIEENTILKDVSLEVKRGDFIYVIGKVGSGKSTLLKSIMQRYLLKKVKHMFLISTY